MTDPITKKKDRISITGFAGLAAERYTKNLRNFFFRRLGSAHDLDDLAQRVFMRLLLIRNADLQVNEPLAFLYKVASRVLADHRAEAALERANIALDGDDAEHCSERVSDILSDRLEEHLYVHQQLAKALEAMEQLSPRLVTVLLLTKRDGLSYEEVAKKLNMTEDAVHKALYRGRVELKRLMSEKKGR